MVKNTQTIPRLLLLATLVWVGFNYFVALELKGLTLIPIPNAAKPLGSKCFHLTLQYLEKTSKSCFPANIYLFKVNNRNTTKRFEICSKLTTKTTSWRHWPLFDCLLWTYFTTFSGASTVDFVSVFACWV